MERLTKDIADELKKELDSRKIIPYPYTATKPNGTFDNKAIAMGGSADSLIASIAEAVSHQIISHLANSDKFNINIKVTKGDLIPTVNNVFTGTFVLKDTVEGVTSIDISDIVEE